MISTLRTAAVLLLLFTLLTGVVYPAFVTTAAQALFPSEANGSLIPGPDGVLGSALIGQSFDEPDYFWSRPSATSPAYNAGASSGSNQGPLNPALRDAVAARVAALRAAHPSETGPVPVDLVTTSGSGLDPHISLAGARYQVARVARARSLSPAVVRRLVDDHTTPRLLGILGEPTVSVLELNLALDRLSARPGVRPAAD